ncbi:hypothetical protein HYX13_04125 [Candidatus Woesearchaeota archaeon]|nr:hypothetical protein [Candidatus Woesearchaeota archaeon]
MPELPLKQLLSIAQQREKEAQRKREAQEELAAEEKSIVDIAATAGVSQESLEQVIKEYRENKLPAQELRVLQTVGEQIKTKVGEIAGKVVPTGKKIVLGGAVFVSLCALPYVGKYSVDYFFTSNSEKAREVYSQVQQGILKPAEARFEYLGLIQDALYNINEHVGDSKKDYVAKAEGYLDALEKNYYSAEEGIKVLEIIDDVDWNGSVFNDYYPLKKYISLCNNKKKNGAEMIGILERASKNKYTTDSYTLLAVASAIVEGEM